KRSPKVAPRRIRSSTSPEKAQAGSGLAVVLELLADDVGHVAGLLFLLFEEGIVLAVVRHFDIVAVIDIHFAGGRLLAAGLRVRLLERNDFGARHRQIGFLGSRRGLCGPRRGRARGGGHGIDGPAFRTDNRRAAEVVKLGAAIAANSLGAKVRLRHRICSMGSEKWVPPSPAPGGL